MNKYVQQGFTASIIKDAVETVKLSGAKMEIVKNLATGAKNYAAIGADVVGLKAKKGIDYALKHKKPIAIGAAGITTVGAGGKMIFGKKKKK